MHGTVWDINELTSPVNFYSLKVSMFASSNLEILASVIRVSPHLPLVLEPYDWIFALPRLIIPNCNKQRHVYLLAYSGTCVTCTFSVAKPVCTLMRYFLSVMHAGWRFCQWTHAYIHVPVLACMPTLLITVCRLVVQWPVSYDLPCVNWFQYWLPSHGGLCQLSHRARGAGYQTVGWRPYINNLIFQN